MHALYRTNILTTFLAKEYIAASSVTKPKTTAAIQQSSSPVDLGWILPQNKGKSTKGKSKEVEVEEDEDTLMADVEAEHAVSTVFAHLCTWVFTYGYRKHGHHSSGNSQLVLNGAHNSAMHNASSKCSEH